MQKLKPMKKLFGAISLWWNQIYPVDIILISYSIPVIVWIWLENCQNRPKHCHTILEWISGALLKSKMYTELGIFVDVTIEGRKSVESLGAWRRQVYHSKRKNVIHIIEQNGNKK